MRYIISMPELETKVKRWGDSLAIIIPKQVAQEGKIKVDDTIHVTIEQGKDFSDVFGILKNKIKKTPQQLKDEAKKGWE